MTTERAPGGEPPRPLPTGTVTFLRTDVEGSMRLATEHGAAWDALNARQLDLIRAAVGAEDGAIVRTEGDAVFAAFPDAARAVRAAIAVQRSLAAEVWPGASIRVRVGLHSGEAHLAGDDYGGFEVSRAARIAAAGHGGQIVISDATRALVEPVLPAGVTIRDLGRHALRDVDHPERLFQLDVPGLAHAFPPLRTGQAAAGNLPDRLTSFLGRERELEAARALLAERRLLTLTGPGGIGKTSLAVELARVAAADQPDGAWLAELGTVASADQVPAAVARALGVHDGPERPARDGVLRFVADRRAIVVLDNFEHVLDAAGFVAELLRAGPGLRIVATSRAPLRIAGEQEVPLGPLAANDGGGDGGGDIASDPAVRLFVERARAARPGWDATADVPVIAEICARLDRLPLGIELAAARVGLLSPAMIRDRLAARLPLPAAGRRDVPARQQTLDGAIAWSCELLDDGLHRLIRRLAVFEGGFDLEQAAAVAGDVGRDVLDGILELADQSLVQRDVAPEEATAIPGGPVEGLRFRILETIRSFCLRELEATGEADDARDRHAEAFLVLAERAAVHWLRADQRRWLGRLAVDHENLRAAVEWSIERGRAATAQRLSAALWRYWQFRGHLREGRGLAERVLAVDPDAPTSERAWALAAAGGLAYWQGDSPAAHGRYLGQLEAARAAGDGPAEADALFNLGATTYITGDHAASLDRLRAARARYEALDDDLGVARTIWGEHVYFLFSNDLERALTSQDGLEERFAAHGDVMYEGLVTGSRGLIHLMRGDRRAALESVATAVAAAHALGDTASATITITSVGIALAAADAPEEAAVLMGASTALGERFGVSPPAGIAWIFALFRPLEQVVAELSDRHPAAWARGAAMTLDEAAAYAIAMAGRADGDGADRADAPPDA